MPERHAMENAPEDSLVRTKSPGQVRQMFHDISPTYDFLNHLLSLNIDRRWRAKAARILINTGTRTILDVCSGTGDVVIAFAAQAAKCGAAPKIVSADFTPAMTAIAKQKFAASENHVLVNSTTTAVGDTLNLPFRESQFDVVSVAFGIRNVADIARGLREMTRVCRPGGKVAVLEFSHPKNAVFRSAYNFYFFRVLPWIGKTITGTRAYMYLPKSVAGFPESSEFTAMFEQAAGGAVRAIPLSFGIATLYVAEVRKESA